jgi:hypothetical protein
MEPLPNRLIRSEYSQMERGERVSSRMLRTTAVVIVVVVLLSLAAVSAVWAKGRPTRAEFTQVSCGSFTVTAAWWKKLNVQTVWADTYLNGALQGFDTIANSSGITSPWSFSRSPGFGSPSTTYTVVVSIYGDTDFPPQVLLDTATTTTTISCSL